MAFDGFKEDVVFQARRPKQDEERYIEDLLSHFETVVNRAKDDKRNHFILCYTGGISRRRNIRKFEKRAANLIFKKVRDNPDKETPRNADKNSKPELIDAKLVAKTYYSDERAKRKDPPEPRDQLGKYLVRAARRWNHVCISRFRYILDVRHHPKALTDFLEAAETALADRAANAKKGAEPTEAKPFFIVAFLNGLTFEPENIQELEKRFKLHQMPFNLTQLLSRIKTEQLLAEARYSKETLSLALRHAGIDDDKRFKQALRFFDTLPIQLQTIVDDTPHAELPQQDPQAWLDPFKERKIPKYDPKLYRGRSVEFFLHYYRNRPSDSEDLPDLGDTKDLVELGFRQADLLYYDSKLRDTLRKAKIGDAVGIASFDELIPRSEHGKKSILSEVYEPDPMSLVEGGSPSALPRSPH